MDTVLLMCIVHGATRAFFNSACMSEEVLHPPAQDRGFLAYFCNVYRDAAAAAARRDNRSQPHPLCDWSRLWRTPVTSSSLTGIAMPFYTLVSRSAPECRYHLCEIRCLRQPKKPRTVRGAVERRRVRPQLGRAQQPGQSRAQADARPPHRDRGELLGRCAG